jgi:hypothetical protein
MERQVGNWLLGFTIGILTTLASQKLLSEPHIANDSEMARAEELISIYKRGVKDALRTTPVSFELEQTCLEVWANKQPVETNNGTQKNWNLYYDTNLEEGFIKITGDPLFYGIVALTPSQIGGAT